MNLLKTLILSLYIFISFTSCKTLFTTSDNALIPLRALFRDPEKINPKISPDGTKLAYCAPVNGILNIYLRTLGNNDDQAITIEKNRGISNFFWSADSKTILYLKDSNGDENYHIYGINLNTKQIKDFTPFSSVKASINKISKNFPTTILIEMNKESPKYFDVYSLDLNSGALILKAKNPGGVVNWLADSSFFVRAAIKTLDEGKQSLLVRDNENDNFKTLLNLDFEDSLYDELYYGLLRFSKDGKKLYLNSSIGHNTRSLISIDIKTGKQQFLATDNYYDLDDVYFNPDTDEPELVGWYKEKYEYKAIGEKLAKSLVNMKSISSGNLNYIQKSDDGIKFILGFLYDNKSYEYYFYDDKLKTSSFLFYARPEINNYNLSNMKPIKYTSRDGLNIHGYISEAKKGKDKKAPMILYVHGGPFSRDKWGYNSVVQFLANRGYSVLQVNFRGSSGYGKKFLALGNGEWGNKMHHDLVDAVAWAIKEGLADEKRIGIFGGSYGGYAALVGATFTPDLFRCAISYVGPSNLITLLKSIPSYWSLSPWERRIGKLSNEDFLKSRSPLFKIDQIKIPIFIAHGAHDVRVTLKESEQLVEALKLKGLNYQYLVFENEGHGFVRPENRLKFYAEVEKFLAKNL